MNCGREILHDDSENGPCEVVLRLRSTALAG